MEGDSASEDSRPPVLNRHILEVWDACEATGWSETVDNFATHEQTKPTITEYFEHGGDRLILYHNLVAVKTKQQKLKAKFRGTKQTEELFWLRTVQDASEENTKRASDSKKTET